jgi:Right handed beta helix region
MRILTGLVLTLLTSTCLTLGNMPSDPKTLRVYVSPAGSDRWSGRIASSNPSKSDGPVRTPEGAQRVVRKMLAANPSLKGSIAVLFRTGTYAVHTTLAFNGQDSGNDSLSIVWTTQKNGPVLFTGGLSLPGFRRITDPAVLSRIRPEYRTTVLECDLRKAGITDFGAITPRSSPGIEFFFQGKRMILSRWPNEGWLKIADVPQSGDSLKHPGLEREKRFDGVPAGRHYGRITYEGSRPSTWARPGEVTMHGYWTFDWSDSYQGVSSIDTVRHEISIAPPYHGYGYTKNQRYYFLNILEEIDLPGEWFLDRKECKLYFWPPAPVAPNEAVVSLLPGPFVTLDGCNSVSFTGIRFEYGRGNGILIRGGARNLIAGCTFRNLGGDAVIVEGGMAHRVQSCDISEMALGGITLRGGDRLTLTPANHIASNNHIHHFGQWVRTGCYALIADGVGHQLDHNLVHDAPFEAITLRGNDHRLEYNEVHHVTQETGDAGAFHTGRNWTWRGNVIRYNYFHDLQGPGLHGVMGVYLDDWACGFTVVGNAFYRAGRATLIGGGRDNVVENNLYVECQPSVHVDARGLSWAGYYLDGTRTELFDEMKEVRFQQPPYSTRYPELLRMYDGEIGVPKYNRITRNISWGGRWMDVYDFLAFDFSVVTVRDNIIADRNLLRKRKAGEQGWDPYYLDIDTQQGYETLTTGNPEADTLFAGNRLLSQPPATFDPVKRTLTFADPSLPLSIGFKAIPFEEIGLRIDDYRRSLP